MQFIGRLIKDFSNGEFTVALSSGIDSVAVLYFLRTKYPKNSIKAFHYNHNLRFQNAEMQKAAYSLCNYLDIPFTTKRRCFCLTEKPTEADLRKSRYQAMMGFGTVITAHHLDDACESYLMNCLNGTPEYLPMPVYTDYGDMDLKIIRPFIICPKEELISYVEDNNLIKFVVEDETNADEHHRRNWLRNSIIPQVSEKGFNLQTIVRKRYENLLISGKPLL